MLNLDASSGTHESTDRDAPYASNLATLKSVLVVVPGTLSGSSTAVVKRAANLAAGLSSELNIHVVCGTRTTSIGTRNQRHFSDALRSAERIIKSERLKVRNILSDDVTSHIRTTIAEMHPTCVFVAKNISDSEGFDPPSHLNWIIDTCDSPLWLVEPGAGSRRPIVLAAIGPIARNERLDPLNRTVLLDAAYLAKLFGAELHVMHAVFKFDTASSELERLRTSRRADIQAWIIELGQTIHKLHTPIGIPDQRLLEFSEIRKPHVVVIGTAHHTTWQRFFDYNVTLQLAESSPSDLLIVHSGSPLLSHR